MIDYKKVLEINKYTLTDYCIYENSIIYITGIIGLNKNSFNIIYKIF